MVYEESYYRSQYQLNVHTKRLARLRLGTPGWFTTRSIRVLIQNIDFIIHELIHTEGWDTHWDQRDRKRRLGKCRIGQNSSLGKFGFPPGKRGLSWGPHKVFYYTKSPTGGGKPKKRGNRGKGGTPNTRGAGRHRKHRNPRHKKRSHYCVFP